MREPITLSLIDSDANVTIFTDMIEAIYPYADGPGTFIRLDTGEKLLVKEPLEEIMPYCKFKLLN